VPTAPAVRVQQEAPGRTTGSADATGLPCATVYNLYVISLVHRAFWPPSTAGLNRALRSWHQRRGVRTTRFRRPPRRQSPAGAVTSIAARPYVSWRRVRPSSSRRAGDRQSHFL